MADRSGIPVTESEILVDKAEARLILNRWMNQVASMDQNDEIILSYSGRNFTTEAATQLARFASLDLVSSRVVAVECSGILGEYASIPDAINAQIILVESLMNEISFCALKLDNVGDRDVAVLRSLLAKETMTHFEMSDCQLTADGGLSDIESSLIDYVPGTAHQPCTFLKHIGFFNLLTNDGDLAAECYASVLSQATSITSIAFVNCGPGLDGSTSIAKALAKVTLCNGQVRESLKFVDMQGCVFNKSFGWICDALDDLERLEYVNLRDCELTPSQKKKIQYKLGIKKRDNPPLLYLDWNDSASDSSADEDDEYEFEYSQAL